MADRPPRNFVFNQAAGVILAAGRGATHSRLAMTDLAAAIGD